MDSIITAVAIVAALMSITFLVATYKKDNSIVDVIWGVGFVLIAAALAFISGTRAVLVPQYLVSFAVIAWGFRLAYHILSRKIGKPEDFRYANWRKTWKNFYVRSLLQIYVLQGVMMLIIAAPLYVVDQFTEEYLRLGLSGGVSGYQAAGLALGLIVWCVGFYFEAMGDYQLAKFKQSKPKKGAIMKTGLWAVTRHPNYFGEITMWWGLWIAVALLPWGWLAIVSPLTITILLLKVSGVTLLEKKWDKNKTYQAYKKTTPAIFPKISS